MVSKGRRWIARIAMMLMASCILHGCTVRLVADYDKDTFENILATGREVDIFYGMLLESPEAQRSYAPYQNRYVEIEAAIRSLWLRNIARADNADSVRIIDDILAEWIRYKNRHSERDAYSTGNAALDRDRLMRMFVAAASAERAKK